MTGFAHDALLYAGDDGFLDGVVPFLRAGLDAEEPMLVAVSERRIGLLREALGTDDAQHVQFADMAAIGRNPACIIPVWREFLAAAGPGRPVRGVGEPVFPERTDEELIECRRHEALLNLAFAGAPAFRLLCPYDQNALAPESLEAARCSHPTIVEDGRSSPSGCYIDPLDALADDDPLPDPGHASDEVTFTVADLSAIRGMVARAAVSARLGNERTNDAVLAISELAANSVRHGGGAGRLAIWSAPGSLICEIVDGGVIRDPLVGRSRPTAQQLGGRGMWIVNQLCDLVHVRSDPDGTRVRIRVTAAA